jgi:hypothetical protein
MARKPSDIQALAKRIEALEVEVRQLREAMSLRRAVDRIWRRTKTCPRES